MADGGSRRNWTVLSSLLSLSTRDSLYVYTLRNGLHYIRAAEVMNVVNNQNKNLIFRT